MTRKAVKQPAITFGKRTDEIAEAYCLPIIEEQARLNKLVTQFQIAEQERVDKENQRIENEQMERERESQKVNRRTGTACRFEPAIGKKQIAAEAAVQETQTALKQVQTYVPPAASRAAGLISKTEVMFEITDAAALYAARPEFFTLEPRRSVIKSAITKDTKLTGLRVWEEKKTAVRS